MPTPSSAATSSLHLVAHPATPCSWIRTVTATVDRTGTDAITCHYVVDGDIERLRLAPPAARPARTDGLWRNTCFELFARASSGASYNELNFSPSGDWAAYQFDDYRQGMRELPCATPVVTAARSPDRYELTAMLTAPGFAAHSMQLAVAVVLEEHEGRICYWALQHPDGKPDFHHRDGFIARI